MSRPALLLVGHGTRSAAGVEEYFALAERVRALAPDLKVGTGFIELSSPPISVAVADLAAAGADAVVVVPLVLFGAGHAKTDVPASIAAARAGFPRCGSRTRRRSASTRPARRRRRAARRDRRPQRPARHGGAARRPWLVGSGRKRRLAKVARLLWEGRPYPLVEVCFVGITAPRLPEGLERCRRLGASRIAVVPYFLFTGVLEERIRAGDRVRCGASRRRGDRHPLPRSRRPCRAAGARPLRRRGPWRDTHDLRPVRPPHRAARLC